MSSKEETFKYNDGPFTVICLEDSIDVTEERTILIETFSSGEAVLAFIKGRRLSESQYAIMTGKLIKTFKMALTTQIIRKE